MRTTHAFLAIIASMLAGLGGLNAQPEAEVRDAIDWLFKAGNYEWEAKRSMASNLQAAARPVTTDSGETQIGGYTTTIKRRFPMVILRDQIAIKTLDGWVHGRDIPRVELGSYGVKPVAKSGEASQGVAVRHPHEELEHLMKIAHGFRKERAEIVADLARTADEFRAVENYMRGTGSFQAGGGSLAVFGGALKRLPSPRAIPAGSSARLYFRLVGPAIDEFRVEICNANPKPVETKAGPVSEFTTVFIRRLAGIGRTKVTIDPIAEALLR